MDNLYFFPTVTKEMLESAGCNCGKYEFSYLSDGAYHPLKERGKTTISLTDKLDSWKIESDGLRIDREIRVQYPSILKGKDGIACENAEFGICIIWTNRALTQMGYIMPEPVKKQGGAELYEFRHEFFPGEIKGDLTLNTAVYIKEAAKEVKVEEGHLINEAGVTVGSIDSVELSFENAYMEFPIKEVNDSQQPLWWLELKDWEDPRRDSFDEENLCLYLNTHYPYCPKIGNSIVNSELLVEIISTAYLMIISKVGEMNYLKDTLNDVNLEPGSISKVIFYFYKNCVVPLKTESIDSLQKSIHQNIELMLS